MKRVEEWKNGRIEKRTRGWSKGQITKKPYNKFVINLVCWVHYDRRERHVHHKCAMINVPWKTDDETRQELNEVSCLFQVYKVVGLFGVSITASVFNIVSEEPSAFVQRLATMLILCVVATGKRTSTKNASFENRVWGRLLSGRNRVLVLQVQWFHFNVIYAYLIRYFCCVCYFWMYLDLILHLQLHFCTLEVSFFVFVSVFISVTFYDEKL